MPWQSYRLSGYAPDLPADALPAEFWSSVSNTTPVDGIQQSSIGDLVNISAGTPITRYEWFQSCRTATGETYVYAGVDFAGPRIRVGWYTGGGAHADLTAGAGWAATAPALNNGYSGGNFSTGVLVNNYGYAPCWVDTSAGTITVLGAALRFSALRPYKYMAIGVSDLAVAGAINTVRWSASVVPGAAPTTWTPAAGNDAGSFDVSSPEAGYLVDGGQLGEDFVIYGENSTHLMTYVGGATVMTSRRLSGNVGILARNCWADIGGAHVVLTRDDVVLVTTAGVEKSLADGRVRRAIHTSRFNADGRQGISQVWFDRQRGHVYITFPGGAPSARLNYAWIYEVASGTWAYRQLGGLTGIGAMTGGMLGLATGSTPGLQQPQFVLAVDASTLAGQALTKVESNSGTQDAATSEWIKADIDLGDGSRRKLITGIRLRGSASSAIALQVTIGGKNSPDEAYTDGSTFTFTLGTSSFAPALISGRWIRVKISRANTGTITAVRLLGFDLEYQWEGAH